MARLDQIKKNLEKFQAYMDKAKDDTKLAQVATQNSAQMTSAYKKAQAALKTVED